MLDLKETVARLIGVQGNISIEPISGGGNNKVYLIIAEGNKYVLKHYFRDKDDKRNRLESEFLFTSFAWDHGIRHIAEPIAKDKASAVGIFRFIEGGRYKPGDIGRKEIEQALSFFRELNQYKTSPGSGTLPNAAEACFSIADHIQLVDCRVDRLKGIMVEDDIDKAALEFVNNKLARLWVIVRKELLSKANHNKISIERKISPEDTVISPSDFGFHNALLGNDEVARFIDFEYAGWDDPAKMVCDFFNQVALPVPLKYLDTFSAKVAESVQDTENTLMRIKLLLPLYMIKWCCIVLNHFLPVGSKRRTFALKKPAKEKSKQLGDAISLLNSIKQLQLKGVY